MHQIERWMILIINITNICDITIVNYTQNINHEVANTSNKTLCVLAGGASIYYDIDISHEFRNIVMDYIRVNQ